MSRVLAAAVVESFDRMDPTNSRELRPSQRMRHKPVAWLSIAGWALVALVAFVTLAAFAR